VGVGLKSKKTKELKKSNLERRAQKTRIAHRRA
jgi:hypothetical protein